MPRGPYWTPDEVERFGEAFPATPKPELLDMFPGRSFQALQEKAREMGLRRESGVSFVRRNPLRRPLTDAELAYIAAIIDGEGHITVIKAKRAGMRNGLLYTPAVGVANQSEALIRWLDERIFWTIRALRPDKSGHTWCYKPSVVGHGAAVLLRTLLPFLVIKGDRAELVIKFCDMRAASPMGAPLTQEEINVAEAARALNRKRDLPTSHLLLPDLPAVRRQRRKLPVPDAT